MRALDLTGQRFGRLVVVGYGESYRPPSGHIKRVCVVSCDCGTELTATQDNLRSGHTRSCGCLQAEERVRHQERSTTHGDSRRKASTTLYQTWASMKRRCYNPNQQSYPNYGGRGIRMCDEWRFSYVAFRDYMLTNHGERPEGCSIDRIDNDGPYAPSNVRWATASQQVYNRRPLKKRVA